MAVKRGTPERPLPRMGLIEWQVVRIGKRGEIAAKHSEGAQTVFGLERARKIQRELGLEWQVRHMRESDRGPDAED